MMKPYTALGTVISKTGNLANFIVDPEWAPRFVSSLFTKLIGFSDDMADKFEEAKEKEEDEGGFSRAMKVMSPAYYLFSKAKEKYKDPETWRSVAAKLEEIKPTIISVTEAITKFVVPALFALLSVYQAISTEDFMNHLGANDEDESGETKKDSGSAENEPAGRSDAAPAPSGPRKVGFDLGDETPESNTAPGQKRRVGFAESATRSSGRRKGPSLKLLLKENVIFV